MTIVGVTVDTFVHVHVEVAPPPDRTRPGDSGAAAFERSAGAATSDEDAVSWPADRLAQLAVAVDDDLGTAYGMRVAEFGGTGSEWSGSYSFRPRPPAGVERLRLTVQAPEQPEVPVRVFL